MQHDIDSLRQAIDIETHGLAHATLDAIALDGLAEHTAGGEANARTQRRGIVR